MMDAGRLHYRFKIDVFSIESLPMARLAEYMAELARLLGEQERVHFSQLERGSAVLVSYVDEPAAPKVTERLAKVQAGTGPKDALKAYMALDNMLAKDNAVGTLVSSQSAEIIPFPGRTRPKPVRYGPFRERGSLDGVVIRVGGRDETVPVHLLDGERLILCQTNRDLSKRLASHYLGSTVRVHGTGKWVREEDGSWQLLEFQIEEFETLDDSPLAEVVEKLRAVEGGRWASDPDTLGDLLSLRRDKGSQH